MTVKMNVYRCMECIFYTPITYPKLCQHPSLGDTYGVAIEDPTELFSSCPLRHEPVKIRVAPAAQPAKEREPRDKDSKKWCPTNSLVYLGTCPECDNPALIPERQKTMRCEICGYTEEVDWQIFD